MGENQPHAFRKTRNSSTSVELVSGVFSMNAHETRRQLFYLWACNSLTRRSEVRFRRQSGKHLLTSRLTGFDPLRTLTTWPTAVSGLAHPLTIRLQFDLLQFGWQGTECHSIN
jgi:hypothetical protein